MEKKTKILPGTQVRFQFGTEKVIGSVKEDRGPIGLGGRRLYFIEFSMHPPVPFFIELPASEFEAVGDKVPT